MVLVPVMNMKHPSVVRPAFWALASAALIGSASAEAVKIRPMLQPGKVYRLLQSQTGETRIAMGELTMDQKMAMELEMKIATAPTDEGGVKADFAYDRVKTSIDMMGQKLEFDSEKPEAANPLLGGALGAFLDLAIEAVYDKDGKVTSFKTSGADSAGDNPLAQGLGLGDDMFRQMAEEFASESYPKEPVEPGAKWTDEKKLPLGQMGEAVVALEFTYVGVEESKEGGPKLPRVDFAGKIKDSVKGEVPGGLAGAGQGNVGLSISQLDMKGSMFYDPEISFTRRSVTDVEMVAEMNNGETTMKIPAKQKVVMELLEIEDAAE